MDGSFEKRAELESLLWALTSSQWLPTLFSATASAEEHWLSVNPTSSWVTTLQRARILAQLLLQRDLEAVPANVLFDILLTLARSLYLINRRRCKEAQEDKSGSATGVDSVQSQEVQNIMEQHQSARRLFYALGLPSPQTLPPFLQEHAHASDESLFKTHQGILLREAVQRVRKLKQINASLFTAPFLFSFSASEQKLLSEHPRELRALFDELFTEFAVRRTLLQERFELTLDVFRTAKLTRLFANWCDLTMQGFRSKVQPYFGLYDVLAARDYSAYSGGDPSRSVASVSSIKHFRIGEMPDRGGRVTAVAQQEYMMSKLHVAEHEGNDGAPRSGNGLKREQARVPIPSKRGRAKQRNLQ